MNSTLCENDVNSLNASFNSTDLEPDPPGLCLALLPPETPYSPIVTTLLVAAMSPVILIIVVGNVLVIYACLTDSKLRKPHHWFLVSLAISDLMVGLLVMPFALVNEVQGTWPFGSVWCEIHVTMDVLACTASIYNLCAIALDRYWCSTRMNYARLQSSTRVVGLIVAVWVLALCVCLPPLMGWGWEHGLTQDEESCGLSSFAPYVILSSTLSFFIPLVAMATLYAMILYSHRSRNNWRMKLGKTYSSSTDKSIKNRNLTPDDAELTPTKREVAVISDSDLSREGAIRDSSTTKSSTKDCSTTPSKSTDGYLRPADAEEQEMEHVGTSFLTLHGNNLLSASALPIRRAVSGPNLYAASSSDSQPEKKVEPPKSSQMVRRHSPAGASQPGQGLYICSPVLAAIWNGTPPQNGESSSPRSMSHGGSSRRQHALQQRERRFFFVIGVVMVTFTLCWLPFFTLYVLCVLWWHCLPRWLFVLSVWLGYCNSALNPAIYAIWNDNIREAFKKALCSKAPREM